MFIAGSVRIALLLTVRPVRVLCSLPRLVVDMEPPPRLISSVLLLLTLLPKVKLPLLVVKISGFATARVLWKSIAPPPLLMTDVPEMFVAVLNVRASLVVVRLTPTLVVLPAALTSRALNVDWVVAKSTAPVPCALSVRVPEILRLFASKILLTVIAPEPVVTNFRPPDVEIRCNSPPEMVICPAVSPRPILPPLLAVMVINPLPELMVLLPCKSRLAAIIFSVLLDAVSDTPVKRIKEPAPLLSESAVKATGALKVRL